ncbi:MULTISPECIES: hypothetical protein [unclassified Mesorhizobium]|uniref:hypothetical protein n=1 Tax=unclassified Mesorhizobium TaxID=325217 RepID=UPI001AEC6C56|nr:hypothetical protein [Mesorhizobium sp. LSJC268A00]
MLLDRVGERGAGFVALAVVFGSRLFLRGAFLRYDIGGGLCRLGALIDACDYVGLHSRQIALDRSGVTSTDLSNALDIFTGGLCDRGYDASLIEKLIGSAAA